jgi:hypothetical protein
MENLTVRCHNIQYNNTQLMSLFVKTTRSITKLSITTPCITRLSMTLVTTKHNGTQQKYTRRKGTRHNDTWHNVLLSVAFFMGMLSEASVLRPSVVLLSVMAPRTSFTFTSLARVFDGLAYKGAPPIT